MTTKFNPDRFTEAFVLGLRYKTARDFLEDNHPHLKGRVGISKKGLYIHNKETGFNELIEPETGEFIGRSPY